MSRPPQIFIIAGPNGAGNLPDVAKAVERVRQRVREGGHDVAEPVIRRRFDAGLKNFEQLYKTLVDRWALYDNSGEQPYPTWYESERRG